MDRQDCDVIWPVARAAVPQQLCRQGGKVGQAAALQAPKACSFSFVPSFALRFFTAMSTTPETLHGQVHRTHGPLHA